MLNVVTVCVYIYIYIYIRNFVSIHGGSIIVVNIIFRCMNVWRFWGFEADHCDML